MKALKLYLENHIEDDLDIIENIKTVKDILSVYYVLYNELSFNDFKNALSKRDVEQNTKILISDQSDAYVDDVIIFIWELAEALGFEDVSDNEAKNNKAMGRFMKKQYNTPVSDVKIIKQETDHGDAVLSCKVNDTIVDGEFYLQDYIDD